MKLGAWTAYRNLFIFGQKIAAQLSTDHLLSFALHTHASSGLSAGDLSEEGIEKRVAQYGRNVIEKKPPKNFFM